MSTPVRCLFGFVYNIEETRMTFLQCLFVIASMSSVLSLATTRKIIKREATGECYQRDVKGNCECCEKNYRGPKCEHHCETCRTINTSTMCEYLCQGGYYGPTCASKCPESCREGNKGIPICTGKNGSFDCTNGCKEGLFGQQCNNQCSVNCRNNICYKISGACDGCKDDYYGQNCDEKCMNCVDGCFQNGTCKGGCREGYNGQMCDTKCLTSCEKCNDKCYRQCQDTCPKTVMEICIQNSTCIYSCSGNHELLHICPNKTIPPQVTEASSVLVIVLPIVIFIVIGIAVLIMCYIKKRRGNSRSSRNYEHNNTNQNDSDTTRNLMDGQEDQDPPRVSASISDQNDCDTTRNLMDGQEDQDTPRESTSISDQNDSDTTRILMDGQEEQDPPRESTSISDQNDSDTTRNLMDGQEDQDPPRVSTSISETIELPKVSDVGRQFNPGIVVITESPAGQKEITQLLDNLKQYVLKGDKGEFTVGEIGSQKIASIHLSREWYGQEESMNLITICLGSFENVQHVIIVGTCNVSAKQRNVIRIGDVVASVSNKMQPYIYVQPSDTGDRTFSPKDNALQKIVKDLEEQLGSGQDSNEVPNLHLGIFVTTGVSEQEDNHGGIVAFVSEVGQVLDSIIGNGIESFLLVGGVSEDQTETAESSLAAASVVKLIVKRIGDSASEMES